ncbi:hypothetical protein AHAS_Ahas07G0152800 [Arachis hypogaea]
MRVEIDGHMGIIKLAETKKKLKEMKKKKRKKKREKQQKKPSSLSESDPSETEVDFSSKSESEKDSEEPRRKQPKRTAKKMQSKKRKHIIEDSSSEEEIHSYDGTEIGTKTIEEFLRQSKKKKTNEEAVAHGVPIQLCLLHPRQHQQVLWYQSNHPPNESTPQPQKVDESTPKVPPAPSKIDPVPEATAAALLMMARIASYVPRECPLSSFSLGFTDSSQEETQSQEGQGQPKSQVEKSPQTTVLIEELDELVEKIAKGGVKTALDSAEGKSSPIEKQTVGQIFDKFKTPTRSNLMSTKMKEKCYLWAIRIRTYGDISTDEYDLVCTLNAQQPLVLSRVHFTSLKATSYVEADIVTAMCLILNQENIKRFQEEIYCLPPNIVNMAIGNHLDGKFLQPKSKKPFKVEDYPMLIPFLDLTKLASHPYYGHASDFCTCLLFKALVVMGG